MTMGDSCGWGYVKHNPNWKTVPQLLQNLCSAASGEGNFLLNVGPKPDGSIRREERVRLEAMGEWLNTYGEAIYGSQRCWLYPANNGTWTRRGNAGYLLIFRWPGRACTVPMMRTRVKSAHLLGYGKKIGFEMRSNRRLVFTGLPSRPVHPYVNAIKVQFAGEPAAIPEPDRAAWLQGGLK